jgi:hypothetical protein
MFPTFHNSWKFESLFLPQNNIQSKKSFSIIRQSTNLVYLFHIDDVEVNL